MIENENDIRAIVRQEVGDKARWVEPGFGSSYGLPDCWIPVAGHCVHLELKVAKVVGFSSGKQQLCFELRPGQKKEIGSMVRDGLKVGLLVGLIKTDLLWFLRARKDVMKGKIGFEIVAEHGREFMAGSTGIKSFERGLNFIFSSSSDLMSTDGIQNRKVA